MKHTIISFYLILSLTASFSIVEAQVLSQKNVLWQYGLNDEYGFFFGDSIALRFGQAYRGMNSYALSDARLDIETKKSGVPSFADKVSSFILPRYDTANTIFIGHSMGGLVAQNLDNRGIHFRGIVTISSLLNGAKVVNSLRPWGDGLVGPSDASFFFQKVIYEALRGVVATSSLTVPGIELVWDAVVNGGVSLVNFLAGGVIVTEVAGIAPLSLTMKDLSVGNAYINTQREKTSATPKIAIWGEAPVPIIDMWAQFAGFENVLNDLRDINYAAYEMDRWIPVIGEHPARESLESYLYLKYGINIDFMNLISNDVQLQEKSFLYTNQFGNASCFSAIVKETKNTCRSWGWFDWLCFPFVYLYNLVRCITGSEIEATLEHVYERPIYGPSDGIVAATSQRGDSSLWMKHGWTKKIDQPVNHLEAGTRKVDHTFRLIFDGEITNPGEGWKSPFYIVK